MIGVGRNESALKQLVESNHISDYIVADLTVPGASETVVAEAVAKLGGQNHAIGHRNAHSGHFLKPCTLATEKMTKTIW